MLCFLTMSMTWHSMLARHSLIKGDLTTPAYSAPLTPEFLKEHPTLTLDTRHFDAAFAQRLLHEIGEVDAWTSALAFHAENSQALQLMSVKCRHTVGCIYIDPPYNTGADSFAYRDSYQHSSWLTMMTDRLQLSESLLASPAAIFVSVDDHEAARLIVTIASENVCET